MPGSSMGFRPEIQGLRAIAVLMVIVHHLRPGALSGGFIGVDMFFVISGYLITAH
ncbi:MAG: acyltransferase family protein, partial [Paeniglutamicibacter terrestris]